MFLVKTNMHFSRRKELCAAVDKLDKFLLPLFSILGNKSEKRMVKYVFVVFFST